MNTNTRRDDTRLLGDHIVDDDSLAHGGDHHGLGQGGSVTRVLINFAKGTIGAGILSMPKAFKDTGVALGSLVYVLVALLATYTMMLLLSNKRMATRKYGSPGSQGMTFAGLAYLVFGKWGKIAVEVTVVLLQLIFCAGYLIVIGSNMHTMTGWHAYWFILLATPLVLLMAFVKKFKDLWLISAFGLSVYIFGVVGLTVIHGTKVISTHEQRPYQVELFSWSMKIASFAATAMYSIEGINLVIPCENALADPSKAGVVIAGGTGLILIFYIFYASFAYIAGFGSCSVSVECLPPGPSTTAVKIMLVIALLFTHPVQIFPAVELAENRLLDKADPRFEAKRYIMKTVMVLFTTGFALGIPNFSFFTSFVGAVFVTAVGFVAPTAMWAKLNWNEIHQKKVLALWNLIVTIIGIALMILGAMSAIEELHSSS